MTYTIEAASAFAGDAEEVYRVLADYRIGHAAILPRWFFSDVEVVEGDIGAGTRVRFRLNTPGRRREVWAVVKEPEPGHILSETDLLSDAVRCFEVQEAGDAVRVTISTRLPASRTMRGKLRGLTTRAFLRRAFKAELKLLRETVGSDVGSRRGRHPRRRAVGRHHWRAATSPPSLGFADGVRSRFTEAP